MKSRLLDALHFSIRLGWHKRLWGFCFPLLSWSRKKSNIPALFSLTVWCTAVDMFLLSALKLPWNRLLWLLKLSFTRNYKGSFSLGQVLQRTNAWRNQMTSRAESSWHMHNHVTIWTKLLSNIWQGKLANRMGVSPFLYTQDLLHIVYLKMCGKPPGSMLGDCPDFGEHEWLKFTREGR